MSESEVRILHSAIEKLDTDFREHRKETRENFQRIFERLEESSVVCAMTRGQFTTEIENLKMNTSAEGKAIRNGIDKEKVAHRWRVGIAVGIVLAIVGWIVAFITRIV